MGFTCGLAPAPMDSYRGPVATRPRDRGKRNMSLEGARVERFEVDALVAEAERRTGGLHDLGEGPFLEPMAQFLESLEREARLNEMGRLIARERVLLHTVNRLGYVNDRQRFPAIADERIVAPVFIIGFPRTGTTILHDILARSEER